MVRLWSAPAQHLKLYNNFSLRFQGRSRYCHQMLQAIGNVFFLSVAGPVSLSLTRAGYFGYKHALYRSVVIGALICTAYFLWNCRASFRHTFGERDAAAPGWYMPTQILAIVSMTFVAFLGADSLVYFLLASITK